MFKYTKEESNSRVLEAIEALKSGRGVLVFDGESRENEVDLIFPAKTISNEQMAQLIHYGSGIVCLCLPESKCNEIGLKLMVSEEDNQSINKTAYTITIEAAEGVTTGVSAKDRVTTIKAAISDNFTRGDIHFPGHVFPLKAKENGVLERQGHTEASVDLSFLAGFGKAGVIAELTNPDGTMTTVDEALEFSNKFNYPLITISDLVSFLE
ncbi:MAG: 3,4-dihydroxy-2-butanone-4-phosphate synthase [Psittacicella sp.]